MAYIPFLLIIVSFLVVYIIKKRGENSIKKNGVRVNGIIIYNGEQRPNSMYRLGANINNPVIRFTTEDDVEITGKPTDGFATQFEVRVPSAVYVIYDKTDPNTFMFAGFV